MTSGSTVPAARRLAAFAVDTPSEVMPSAVGARATLHLLDVVGCGVAAVGVGAADEASAIATMKGGTAEASVFGAPARVPAASAALANGTRFHALDFDDTHEAGICHASAVVAPAALAVGEATRASGSDVLTAYVIGCEVAIRVAIAAADGLYARGFHPTGVCGAFGAAASAARLLALDERQAAAALGIVGSFASGLLEYLADGSATKPLHAGWAAMAGVQAAGLAAVGGAGPATVIEGRFGVLSSHGASTDGAAQRICDDLGDSWETAAMSLKPFPACHFAHSSTWAAVALAREHDIATQEIESIVVRIPNEGLPLVLDPLEQKAMPKTPYDAKFSLPYAVAHHLVHGGVELSSFTTELIAEPDVLQLAARVRAEPITAADGPYSRFAGGARIVTRGGAEHDRFLAHAPGSPGNPLEDAWVVAKFLANAELGLSREDAGELAQGLRHIAELETLEPLVGLVRDARPAASWK